MNRCFRILVSFLCFPPLISLAQTPRADSLKRVLGDAKIDTMQVNMLGELAFIMRSVKPDSALKVGHQSYALAKELHFDQKIDNILRVLGIIHFYGQQLDSAGVYFKKSEKLALESGDKMTLASVLLNQATLYRYQKNIPKALATYERALALERERGNKAGEGAAFNNMGAIFLDQKNYEKAEQYFLKGLRIQEELGAKPTIIILLINLGLVATFQNDLSKSISYYTQALALTREIQNKNQESKVLIKMGLAYKLNGQFARSLDYYLQNLQLWEELQGKRKISQALMSLANLYEENNDLEMAETYYTRAISICKDLGDNNLLASNVAGLGEIYIKQQKYRASLSHLFSALALQEKTETSKERITASILQKIGSCYIHLNQSDSASRYLNKAREICEKFRAEITHTQTLLSLSRISKKQGNIQEAIARVEEGLDIASGAGLKKLHAEAAETLYRLYKIQNNSSKALTYLEMHNAIQDSLFNKENTRALTQIEANYKFEQEKQQLSFEQEQKLTEEKNAQKVTLIALVVAILMMLAFAWYYFQKQKANKLLMVLNEEVNAQKSKLEELDILKSRFFTHISHEFRTPLTVIGGMVDQIKTEPQKWTERGLDLIQRNNKHLLDLVNQILELRKLESGTLKLDTQRGDIVLYLNYIFESFQSLAEKKDIGLHFLCEIDQLVMGFDREKLLRIVSNLLSNAIKFTHEGGNIYLMVDISDQQEGIHEKRVKLSVKDTGAGIPEAKLPYIFDRFYQVDVSSTRRVEGTGIGLALTKELVDLMHGEISVESRLNKGSIFTVILPVCHETPLEGETQGIPNFVSNSPPIEFSSTPLLPHPEEKQCKVLIIEDNPDVVIYLASILENEFQISVARDGKAGIEFALEHIPDLIISDIMMPVKDGYEVCATLKEDERSSHIPIILLTAKADEESRLQGLHRGADAYLSKPFNKQELFIRLEQLYKLRQKLQARYANLELPEGCEDTAVKQEDAFIKKLRAVIEENIQNPDLGVDMLCETMGLSRTQLYMKVKALTNRSATQYIRAIRLFHAKELLQSTEQPVSQVAYEVGFSDPSYFSRAFSKEYGFPPKNLTKKKY